LTYRKTKETVYCEQCRQVHATDKEDRRVSGAPHTAGGCLQIDVRDPVYRFPFKYVQAEYQSMSISSAGDLFFANAVGVKLLYSIDPAIVREDNGSYCFGEESKVGNTYKAQMRDIISFVST
jgi:hypothetical protein